MRVRARLVAATRHRAPQPGDVWQHVEDGRQVEVVGVFVRRVCYRNRATQRRGSSMLEDFRRRFERLTWAYVLPRRPQVAANDAA